MWVMLKDCKSKKKLSKLWIEENEVDSSLLNIFSKWNSE